MKLRSLALVFVSLLVFSSAAWAEPRAVVREFEGANGKRVRGAVVSALEEHSVALVASDDADAEAKRQGVDLDNDAGRVAVGRELQVGAFVEGQVDKAGAKYRVSITAYGGADGSKLAVLQLTASKAAVVRAVRDGVWAAIGAAVEEAKPPSKEAVAAAEPEAAPVAEAEPEAEPEPEPEAQPAADSDEDNFEPEHSPLDVSVGASFGNRNFAYKDAFPGLRDYKLGLSPSLALHAHWYPAAHVTNGFLANLGLDLRFNMLVGVKSKNSAGTEFSTSSTDLGVGVRVRVPLDKNELGVLLGYSMHSFSIDKAKSTDPGVPDVSHASLRAGVDGRWVFMDPLSLYAAAAYLLSVSPGEIGDAAWFPNTSGGGVQAELGLGFAVVDALELQLGLELQRYFFTFDPKPTDDSVVVHKRVAGGALDQFISLRVSAVWRM